RGRPRAAVSLRCAQQITLAGALAGRWGDPLDQSLLLSLFALQGCHAPHHACGCIALISHRGPPYGCWSVGNCQFRPEVKFPFILRPEPGVSCKTALGPISPPRR